MLHFLDALGNLDVLDLPVPVYIPAYLGCVYY